MVLFVACQKEIEPFDDSGPPQPGNSILGTWNLISLTGITQSTAEINDADINYKTITYSNYTTTNNKGTITFIDSTLTSANIGYFVSSTLVGYNYENGVLIDSTKRPFSISIDSSSSSAKYKLIGSDSIYFPEGGFVSTSGASPAQSPPAGGKYSIIGNILTITQLVNTDTTEEITGALYYITDSGKFISRFQKK